MEAAQVALADAKEEMAVEKVANAEEGVATAAEAKKKAEAEAKERKIVAELKKHRDILKHNNQLLKQNNDYEEENARGIVYCRASLCIRGVVSLLLLFRFREKVGTSEQLRMVNGGRAGENIRVERYQEENVEAELEDVERVEDLLDEQGHVGWDGGVDRVAPIDFPKTCSSLLSDPTLLLTELFSIQAKASLNVTLLSLSHFE